MRRTAQDGSQCKEEPLTIRACNRPVCGRLCVEEIALGNDIVVTTIPSMHRVTSHAIAVWRNVRKLKAELQGLTSEEIGQRRKVRQTQDAWDASGLLS